MRTLLTAGGAVAVFAAVSPGSLAAAQYDPSDRAVAEVVSEDCTQPGASRATAKRGGPLGWLMRGGRDERDDEEGPDADVARQSVSIGYYLRSPLLTSLFSTVPCPPTSEKRAEAPPGPPVQPEHCARLVIRWQEGEEVVELRLPFMGASTAAGLRTVVSDHQARGEPLLVPTSFGETELSANAIREVRPGRC
jgi:hypothetical protein